MVELMQNLIELGRIFERMAEPLPPLEPEVTSVERETYNPVDGITFI